MELKSRFIQSPNQIFCLWHKLSNWSPGDFDLSEVRFVLILGELFIYFLLCVWGHKAQRNFNPKMEEMFSTTLFKTGMKFDWSYT